jgi:hypothetical protein
MLDALKRMTSLAVTAGEHAIHVSVIIEEKVASEAKAIANAITPEVQAAGADLETRLQKLTEHLAGIRAAHEAAHAADASPASVAGASQVL